MSARFSMILASAGNREFLGAFYASLGATVKSPKDMEVLIYFDHGASVHADLMPSTLQVHAIFSDDKPYTVQRALQTLRAKASGEYLLHINDDIIFDTVGWDGLLMEVFKKHGKYCFPFVANGFQWHLNTFPVLHRDSWDCIKVEAMPYERFYVDTHIHEVYKRLARMGHKLIIRCPEIVFRHTWQRDSQRHKRVPGALQRDGDLFHDTPTSRQVAARKIADMIEAERANT